MYRHFFVHFIDSYRDLTYFWGVMAGFGSALSSAIFTVSVNYLKDVHSYLLLVSTNLKNDFVLKDQK